MADDVKRRTYDNSRRSEAARATRRAVVGAAGELFLEAGYPATTLAEIAARAGVSVQTVYGQFGNKRAVLKEVVDQAVAGDDEPVPLADRAEVDAMRAERDPRRVLAMQAAQVRTIQERLAPLDRMVRSAAAVDPEAAEQWQRGARQRQAGMGQLADHLARLGALAPGRTAEAAADRLAVLIDPELWRLTVVDRGWTPQRYEDWLADLLAASVLG